MIEDSEDQIQQFLHYLTNERRYSVNTVLAYKKDLASFVQFLTENGALPVSQTFLIEMLNYLWHS